MECALHPFAPVRRGCRLRSCIHMGSSAEGPTKPQWPPGWNDDVPTGILTLRLPGPGPEKRPGRGQRNKGKGRAMRHSAAHQHDRKPGQGLHQDKGTTKAAGRGRVCSPRFGYRGRRYRLAPSMSPRGKSPTYPAWRMLEKLSHRPTLEVEMAMVQRVVLIGTDKLEYEPSVPSRPLVHIKGPSFVGISGESTGSELEHPLMCRRIPSGDATDAAAPIDPTFPPRPSEEGVPFA